MDDIVKELRSLVQPHIFDSRPVDAQIIGDAADYIERLEAVVRRADEMRLKIIGGAGGLKRIQTANAYDAARSRVNLSTQADADGKEASE